MSETGRESTAGEQRARQLRLAVHAVVTLEVLLWIAAVLTIGWHAAAKGDGIAWAAVVPATVILALGVAPPLAFRRDAQLLRIALVMAVAGVLMLGALLFVIAHQLG